MLLECRGEGIEATTYPGVVELCLHTHHVAFLLILVPQNLKFRGLERRLSIDGIWYNTISDMCFLELQDCRRQ